MISNLPNEAKKDETNYEVFHGEASYKTPTLSSDDSCTTSTLTSVSEEKKILIGDFDMCFGKGLPELTLGLIKPDGMKYYHEIERRIKNEGFDIIQVRVFYGSTTKTKGTEKLGHTKPIFSFTSNFLPNSDSFSFLRTNR